MLEGNLTLTYGYLGPTCSLDQKVEIHDIQSGNLSQFKWFVSSPAHSMHWSSHVSSQNYGTMYWIPLIGVYSDIYYTLWQKSNDENLFHIHLQYISFLFVSQNLLFRMQKSWDMQYLERNELHQWFASWLVRALLENDSVLILRAAAKWNSNDKVPNSRLDLSSKSGWRGSYHLFVLISMKH